MESYLVLFALAGIVTLAMRWLLLRGLSPVSQQSVRQLFVERLLATTDRCVLLQDDGGLLSVQCGKDVCAIRFETLYRQCMESPYRTILLIRQAVKAVQDALQDAERLPADWETRVVPLLLNGETPAPPDAHVFRLISELQVGYVLDGEEAFRWITATEMEQSGIGEENLHALALRNLERSCSMLVIETPPPLADGRDRLLRFHTQDGLDAVRSLLPSFYQRFAPRFGDVDVLVAIPTRDSLIAIPATDQAQASFLQWRAEAECRRSAHPLSGKLLCVTEAGIEEWEVGEMTEDQ